ncbi:hypothetical protein MANES_08G103900v8 [Manihot esculenta]|uniref:Uncharacterized protein n=1 Tax=Manihot esculenta TaxID=3983 RepID=A0A2C9VF38_MANES|nr:hypothetical protein MANES_08G103900v8 [Manihot esculenta]
MQLSLWASFAWRGKQATATQKDAVGSSIACPNPQIFVVILNQAFQEVSLKPCVCVGLDSCFSPCMPWKSYFLLFLLVITLNFAFYSLVKKYVLCTMYTYICLPSTLSCNNLSPIII